MLKDSRITALQLQYPLHTVPIVELTEKDKRFEENSLISRKSDTRSQLLLRHWRAHFQFVQLHTNWTSQRWYEVL